MKDAVQWRDWAIQPDFEPVALTKVQICAFVLKDRQSMHVQAATTRATTIDRHKASGEILQTSGQVGLM